MDTQKSFGQSRYLALLLFYVVMPLLLAFSCDEDGQPLINNIVNGEWYLAEIQDEDLQGAEPSTCPTVKLVFADGDATIKVGASVFSGTYKAKLNKQAFEFSAIETLNKLKVPDTCPVGKKFIDRYQTLYKYDLTATSLKLYYGPEKYMVFKKIEAQ